MPIRTCVGCRQVADKGDLVRITLADGSFVLDAAHRLPGRGAYLHRGCAQRALRIRGVQRTLKVAATPSTELERLLGALTAPDAV